MLDELPTLGQPPQVMDRCKLSGCLGQLDMPVSVCLTSRHDTPHLTSIAGLRADNNCGGSTGTCDHLSPEWRSHPCNNGRVHLTKPQARRIILAAQGIGHHRDQPVGMRQLQSAINRLGQFQIDSVNVLARAHLMPMYTRFGAYDPLLLKRAAQQSPRRLFEYWGHAASLIDIDLYPAFQFRRDRARAESWGRMQALADAHPEIIDTVLTMIQGHGPATARDLDLGERRTRDNWGWNWSNAKTALEWLNWSGQVAIAGRNSQFERLYDAPGRVIPRQYLDATASWANAQPDDHARLTHQAHVTLIRRAATALGVATLACLRDYFRTALAPTRAAIADLEAAGELLPVSIDGLSGPAWLWHEARHPRTIQGSTLVSPFDSLVFERSRLAAFFDIDYRIGIYTPKTQRTHGYYVYLLLVDERFAARVDLKADRRSGRLLVQSAWLEPDSGVPRSRVISELVTELGRLTGWLGVGDIHVAEKGDLATDLAKHL